MHSRKEMTAKMRYMDLTANSRKLQLLDLQERVKDGYKAGQSREWTGKIIGRCRRQKFKASCNGRPND